MYLNVKCNCVDFVLTVTPKQILNAYKQKPICEECGSKYKFKSLLTYNKKKYITVPDFPSEVKMNIINVNEIKDYKPINMNNSYTEIIVPLKIERCNKGMLVYTETKVYPVLSNSPSALYLWGFHQTGSCKICINEDGYIYLAEKTEV